MATVSELIAIVKEKIKIMDKAVKTNKSQREVARERNYVHTVKAYTRIIKKFEEGARTYRECLLVLEIEGQGGVDYVKQIMADFDVYSSQN